MGLKDDFSRTSILGKVNFFLLLIANLFNWIAFCTSEWYRIYNTNLRVTFTGYGVWKTCSSVVSGCTPLAGTASDWYGAFQAFAIFGFIGINIAFFLLVLMIFTSKCSGNGDANMAAAITAILGAVCYLIAVIIFGVEITRGLILVYLDFGYSFALAIIALVMAFIAGILLIVSGKKSGTSPA